MRFQTWPNVLWFSPGSNNTEPYGLVMLDLKLDDRLSDRLTHNQPVIGLSPLDNSEDYGSLDVLVLEQPFER